MLFFGIKNIWFRLGIFLVLTILTAFFIYKMHQNYYVTDPYNPALTGTAVYGHNGDGAFAGGLQFILIEYFILLIVLLTYSFSRLYFIRTIILQIVFGCWFCLMAVAGMHGGGVHAIHVLWLLAVNVIIFILMCLSIVAEVVGNNKNRQTQNFYGTQNH